MLFMHDGCNNGHTLKENAKAFAALTLYVFEKLWLFEQVFYLAKVKYIFVRVRNL